MRTASILSVFLLNFINLFGGVIHLEGIYHGDNLYVMNPFSPSGVGFCIYEVRVNGQITTDEINSSAFEIDLSVYGFELGDKVVVDIYYHDGCSPKVLNPEVLKPKSTYNVESIKLDKSGKLIWVTSGEIGSLPFIVEQFKWNKWVPVAKVQGKGTAGYHTYSVNVHFHSGLNRFRVKQVDYTKKPRYSPEVTYNNPQPPVTFKPGNGGKTSKYITFSAPTEYEIYDYYGQLKKKGYAKQVDVSSLPSGTYFLNYDTKTEVFEKK